MWSRDHIYILTKTVNARVSFTPSFMNLSGHKTIPKKAGIPKDSGLL